MIIPVINTKMFLLYICLTCLVFELANGSSCGDGQCTCDGVVADCSYTARLNYIPKLPDHIQKVDFSGNDVERIDSADFFLNVTQISSLSMRSNGLTYIAPGAFDILQNLTSLDISSNYQLKALPENTFSHETRSRLLHFNAAGNSFQCRCDLKWFSEWLISNSSVFHPTDINSYVCYNDYFMDKPYTMNIVELSGLNKQACLLSSESLSVIILISIILLALFVLRLLLKIIKSSAKQPTIQQSVHVPFRLVVTNLPTRVCTTDVAFKYDVFVAYAEEDNDFVSDHLRPRLEDELGLKLCLHQRDFRPGRNILENIEDSVTSSKKVLMVFSTHFAHSPWCQFELAVCQRHAMDRGDLLLVVHVNNTPVSDLTPTMVVILRTCTYIAWSQEGQGRVIFWNSLLLALGDVLAPHAPPYLQPRQQPQQQPRQQPQQQPRQQPQQQPRQQPRQQPQQQPRERRGVMNPHEEQGGETVIV